MNPITNMPDSVSDPKSFNVDVTIEDNGTCCPSEICISRLIGSLGVIILPITSITTDAIKKPANKMIFFFF